MPDKKKHCPKCRAQMDALPLCLVAEQQAPVFHSQDAAFRGIAVEPFLCPNCRYVEFYAIEGLKDEGLSIAGDTLAV
jgi:predicted nucleic-acid-binding Zn-ribbon protein